MTSLAVSKPLFIILPFNVEIDAKFKSELMEVGQNDYKKVFFSVQCTFHVV